MIPSSWEAEHATVAGKTRTVTCTIRPPASTPAKINPDLSYTPTWRPDAAYEGTCRVQALNNQDRTRLFGDEYQSTTIYLVAIDYEATGIGDGFLVEVTESNDPDLGGKQRLVVIASDLGSLRFERDLYCVDINHK